MKSKGTILIHVFFWSIFFVPIIWTSEVFTSARPASARDIFWQLIYTPVTLLSVFYVNYLLLIPQLIKNQKRYVLYIISLVVVVITITALKTSIAWIYPDIIFRKEYASGKMESISLGSYAINNVFVNGFLLVFSLLIKLTIDWFSNERIQRNLETEKKEMELQFLKSQLNPHFLFNSLNNIYSLAYQKSEKTADAVLKLSEIMRYMIYESNDSKSDLGKEVDYLKNYIDLHKLRFKDDGAVELTINGEIDGQQIVPLILISFVENAFKHGVVNDKSDPVKISLIANQKILHFSVTNKKNKDMYKDKVGGIGLSNVERRLQLMYPDRYKLNIVNSATHYTTELMLDL
ncbi:MAG: histidine kinase [Flavobacterium sp.]|nr:MAG: histidine kinase [Flavobacterium sp.]